ncbi:MAG: beta-N-acetylhexosaminidase [Phycisphaerales bacterium]|jgi:hexosaminidase|nr:beta-N-acetylhexosaminidase [Phycisphaerales bacterium]MBT7171672.1 beta-N-acetylhexosaminidase [Phycisphaerales bacterium]
MMNRIVLLLVLLTVSLGCMADSPKGAKPAAVQSAKAAPVNVVPQINVIPRPAKVQAGEGEFVITAKTQIVCNKLFRKEAEYLRDRIKTATGWNLGISEAAPSDDAINLLQNRSCNLWNAERYTLEVSAKRVVMIGESPAGIFHGIQTLRQLLPVEIESAKPVLDVRWVVPGVKIQDNPRYEWRGLMIDEGRHFFGKAYVKQILEQMALRKMNVFHWHLTDMPGWRIEIKAWPKLATVGGKGDDTDPNGPVKYYTQDDIREIVAYAKARHIMVVPEIDMPGHATAANRAYPEFSGGGSKKHPEFTFNPGSEKCYSYLTDILKETAELFPAPFLHYGGDEAHFGNKKWSSLPGVQALMKKENLKDLIAVEQFFNRRMATVIDSLGKTTVGWDEIVNAGVPADKCIVMWWRHTTPKALATALSKGYKVVLCPRVPCYFDFVQHASHKVGRRWKGKYGTLKLAYEYPVFPEGTPMDKLGQIVGIQANLWTEKVGSTARANFMTYPRLSAIAEAGWSTGEKDFTDFQRRLKPMLKRLDLHGVNYFNPFDLEKTPEMNVHGTVKNPGKKK